MDREGGSRRRLLLLKSLMLALLSASWMSSADGQQQPSPQARTLVPDLCDRPARTGRCAAYFERFYWDKGVSKCRKFIYGGCGNNGNNFETEEECLQTCASGDQTAASGARLDHTLFTLQDSLAVSL